MPHIWFNDPFSTNPYVRIRSCCNGRSLLGMWLLLVLHPINDCGAYMSPTIICNCMWTCAPASCMCTFKWIACVLKKQGSWGWSGCTLWHSETRFGCVFWGQTTKCPRSPGLGSRFGSSTRLMLAELRSSAFNAGNITIPGPIMGEPDLLFGGSFCVPCHHHEPLWWIPVPETGWQRAGEGQFWSCVFISLINK